MTPLRVGLLAGTLAPGGAEKQLVYMARALLRAGVTVQVYSLTRGGPLEAELCRLGVPPLWVGRWSHPLLRVMDLAWALRRFQPHVLQAGHFFTNLYVSLVARLYGSLAIGAVRCDAHYSIAANGSWGSWLLRVPPNLLANSYAAKRNVVQLGVAAEHVCVVPSVIDVAHFQGLADGRTSRDGSVVVAALGNQIPVKRLDRFLVALALARRQEPTVRGIIVGDGSERCRLEALAQELDLVPDGVRFLGYRSDVARLLGEEADVLALTSDHEGCPNVVLEAMAAGLPVITTPAGDAGVVVQDEVTGYVVPFGAVEQLADRIVRLARSPEQRRRLGAAGRSRVVQQYAWEQLGERLLAAYEAFAARQGNRTALAALAPRVQALKS